IRDGHVTGVQTCALPICLRPGISPLQAQEALTGTFAAVVKQTVGNVDPKEWKPLLDFVPARGIGGYNEQYRTPVGILMGLVGLVDRKSGGEGKSVSCVGE